MSAEHKPASQPKAEVTGLTDEIRSKLKSFPAVFNEGVISRWFEVCTFAIAQGIIFAPSVFHAERMRANFESVLRAVFGQDIEIVACTQERHGGCTSEMEERFSRIRAEAKRREEAGEITAPPPAPAKTAEVIEIQPYLPMFADEAVGTPDCFLQSSLFAATDRGREYLDRQVIPTLKGPEITFTGKQLTQHHLVLWEALVRFARLTPLGDECLFTGHSFLRSIGYKGKIGKTDYNQLVSDFTYMKACAIEVRVKGEAIYTGGIIEKFWRDDGSKVFKVILDKRMSALFGRGQWTQLQWDNRTSLKKYPLALWLQGYYAPLLKPYPLSVKYLHERSGSKIKQLYHFRQELKKAFNRLLQIGVITGWGIDPATDLVHVEKTPTASQARALLKPPKKLKP
jgi:hypothetical protein